MKSRNSQNTTRTTRWRGRMALLGAAFALVCTVNAQVATISGATPGGLNASYPSVTAAFAALNGAAVTGTVTMTIDASNVEAGPCVLNTNTWTSLNIYPSVTGRIISATTTTGRGVIELNGADNVTINGALGGVGTTRDLTFTHTAAATITYTSVIRVAVLATTQTTADGNTIKNCFLNGSAVGRNAAASTSTTGSENTTFGIYAGGNGGAATPTAISSVTTNTAPSGTTINNLSVTNNAINQCARGIVYNGAVSTVSPGTLLINNNTLGTSAALGAYPFTTPTNTVYTKGIYVNGATTLTITGNTLNNILSYVGTAMSGIELAGAITATATTIDNNVITAVTNNGTSSGANGILVSSHVGGTYSISGNTIANIQDNASSSIAAISTTGSATSGMIQNNQISTVWARSTGGYAARGILINAGNNVTIQNNFIWDINMYPSNSNNGTTYGSRGIQLAAGTGHKVLHNTISLAGPVITSASTDVTTCLGIATTSMTGIDVRNNIFSNTMTGGSATTAHMCIQLPSGGTSSMGLTLNNNALYQGGAANSYIMGTTGPVFYTAALFVPGATTPGTNMRAYTSTLSGAGTNDNASLAFTSAAPFFTSTNLHINTGLTATQLESGGASGTGVTLDIDGQARPGPAGSVNGGASANDIGADEFDGVPLDLTAPSISYTALGSTCATTGRTLVATITDASGVPTAGAGLPVLYYKSTSTYPTYTAVTSTFGAGVYTFTPIAPGVTVGETISYYVAAQDGAGTPNVGSNPSTGASGPTTNPPNFSTPTTTPNTYNIQSTLAAGTYTIPSMYATITAAVADYNTKCLGGNIVFSVEASYTGAGETFPITIGANADADASHTLTIQPAAGASPTISGSSATGLIVLNGADYVRIQGSNAPVANACCPVMASSRNLTITNTNTGANAVILISSNGLDGATNNAVRNCVLIGGAVTGTWGVFSGSTVNTAATAPNNNLTVENNDIRKVRGGVGSIGVSAANKTTGTSITQNIMNSVSPNHVGDIGILVWFDNGAVVSCNNIANLATSNASTDCIGITIGGPINVANSTSTGNETTNATVTKNVIGNFVPSSTYSSAGIWINPAPTGTTTVANNMIYQLNSNGTFGDFACGIWVGGGAQTTRVYYNTVDMNKTFTGGGYPSIALAIAGADPIVDVKNNILTSTGSTGGTLNRAIMTLAGTVANLSSDYNDLHVTGAGSFVVSTGTLSAAGTTYTMGTWQAVPKDVNSKNVAPVYNAFPDLHLDAANGSNIANLLSSGTVVSVTDDIDCQSRGGSPSMGADHITVANCTVVSSGGTSTLGAGPYCAGGTTSMSNAGATSGLGISYQWQVSSTSGSGYVDVTGGTGATTTNYTTGALSAGTFYYVLRTVCDADPGNPMLSNEVTLVVTAIPTPTITPGGPVSFCVSGSLSSSIASGNVWSPGGATTQAVTATANGNYFTTVTTNGCVGVSPSVAVSIDAQPGAVTVTPPTPAMCEGGSVNLAASGGTYTATGTLNFGTQAATNTASVASTDYPAPFNVYYGGQRMQMLIRASELSAAGFTAGTQFSSINFPVASLGANWGGSITSCQSFMVKFGYTAATTITTFQSLATTVRPAANFTPVVGYANDLAFSTLPAAWNGTDNVIIETTFSNAIFGATADAVFQYNSPAGFASAIVYRADSQTPAAMAAAATPTYTYTSRPDFKLNGSVTTQAPFTWTPPASGLNIYSGANVTATPSGTQPYTVTATNGACTSPANVTVTVQPAPNAGSNSSLNVCATNTTNDMFAALGGTPDGGGTWSPAGPNYDATTMSPGVYTYTVNAIAPCTGSVSATVTVTEQAAPNTGTNASLTVCATSTTNDMFAALGGTPDGGGTWSPAGPNYDATTMSPGVYTYTVNATAPCTGSVSASVTVTEQAAPNAGTNGSPYQTCDGAAPFSLLALLGGSPQMGGTWSGPSAVVNDLYDASTMDPGTYMYTINAVTPCTGSASASVAISETGNQVVLRINTDGNADQTSWAIRDVLNNVIATGGPYTSAENNSQVDEVLCLSNANGDCYGLQLYDSFGDGIFGGNWQLRTTSGKVLLGDDFASGANSPSVPPQNPGYGSTHGFCLPEGPANIAPTECGIMNNTLLNKVYCNKVIGASNYQFEFSDPDAGYIRRIARNRNYIIFNEMLSVPLTPGVKYFARVRTDRDGPLASAHFGAGCEMGLGLAQVVPCTELIHAPAYGHSCDETRTFNTSANNSFIYAKPVVGGTEYQFRLINTSEGYDHTFIRSTYILMLKWNTSVAPLLVDGNTYNVEINVKVNGLYSGFCASDCDITIANGGERPEASMTQANGSATLWPNPVRDGQVNLNIEGIQDADQQITVDIQDIYGKQVFAKEYGNSGDRFNTILNLSSDIASGVYLVNITVNGKKTVQRLSIIR